MLLATEAASGSRLGASLRILPTTEATSGYSDDSTGR